MSDMKHGEVSIDAALASTAIGRRKLMGSMVAISAAATMSAPALAATGTKLLTFKGRYAMHGGKIIAGYFAAPRGKRDLGVIVVMGDGAKAEAAARNYASAGYLAIAPDLNATYRDRAFASREAMVADLMGQLHNLKHMPQGDGSVKVVSA